MSYFSSVLHHFHFPPQTAVVVTHSSGGGGGSSSNVKGIDCTFINWSFSQPLCNLQQKKKFFLGILN